MDNTAVLSLFPRRRRLGGLARLTGRGIISKVTDNAVVCHRFIFMKLDDRLMEGEERAGRQCLGWASSVVLAWASLTAKEHGIAALPVALLFDVVTFYVKLVSFFLLVPSIFNRLKC